MPVGNNTATVKVSNLNYTQSKVRVAAIERGKETGGEELARNWLDGIYGETVTAIKYPVFQGTTYSMNYISQSDAFLLAKALTDEGNIYGFDKTKMDSHLMKNSEWGAVTYLSQSQYGLQDIQMCSNNINLLSGNQERTQKACKHGVDSVYGVTGCTTGNLENAEKNTTIENINRTTANIAVDGVYTWNQLNGTKASSTGNVYGIYDLKGGEWEVVSSYIANENPILQKYAEAQTYGNGKLKKISTKYTTVYPHNTSVDNNTITSLDDTKRDYASNENWKVNSYIFGDSIRETSSKGTADGSWYNGYSYYPSLDWPIFVRGGCAWDRRICRHKYV